MAERDEVQRAILLIPDRPLVGLVTDDDHSHQIDPDEHISVLMARQ